MNRKLTLSLDSDVVEFAHGFSQRCGKPISRIVEDYFVVMREQGTAGLPDDLRELHGIFEGLEAPDRAGLRRMFHEKYRD